MVVCFLLLGDSQSRETQTGSTQKGGSTQEGGSTGRGCQEASSRSRKGSKKVEMDNEAAAIAASKAEREKEAAQVAKRKAFEEEAKELIRQQAQEAADRQAKLAATRMTPAAPAAAAAAVEPAPTPVKVEKKAPVAGTYHIFHVISLAYISFCKYVLTF